MRRYQGYGTYTAQGMPTIEGNFTLEFEDNGKYSMQLIPENLTNAVQYMKLPFTLGKFSGSSSNPYSKIEIDTIYLNSVKIGSKVGTHVSFQIFSPIKVSIIPQKSEDVVEFKRGITNFLFWGTEIIQQGTYMTRGKTTWQ